MQTVVKTTRPRWHYGVLIAARVVSLLAIFVTLGAVIVGGGVVFTGLGVYFGTVHFVVMCLNVWAVALFYLGHIDDQFFFFCVNLVASYVFIVGFS